MSRGRSAEWRPAKVQCVRFAIVQIAGEGGAVQRAVYTARGSGAALLLQTPAPRGVEPWRVKYRVQHSGRSAAMGRSSRRRAPAPAGFPPSRPAVFQISPDHGPLGPRRLAPARCHSQVGHAARHCDHPAPSCSLQRQSRLESPHQCLSLRRHAPAARRRTNRRDGASSGRTPWTGVF